MAERNSSNLESKTGTHLAPDLFGDKQTEIAVTRTFWHGWPGCYLIANDSVEAIVVPAIGRVMQLRLKGEIEGPLWENRALDGQQSEPASTEWINFGGDKSWPAPQTDWPLHQGREWPPPPGFDSGPVEAVAGERGVVLTSHAEPDYGIQVTRQVELDAEQPVMRIRTEFRKLLGPPVTVGVWSITQLQDPERVFIPLREESKMRGGFIRLIEAEPEGLRIEGGLLSLVRHKIEPIKIGTDASSMVWVGSAAVLRIDAEEGPGEYPDGGSVAQVYTNPDPVPYVELETQGPLATMSAGDRIERTTTYTIMARSTADAEAEARKILRFGEDF
jgi:hypothetical protein